MAPLRLFITGASGWTGAVLARLACGRGASVWNFSRTPSGLSRVVDIPGDLSNGAAIGAALQRAAPDAIVHLAAVMPGATDWSDDACVEVNVGGTGRLFEAVKKHAPRARVIVASSSGVYAAMSDQPLGEDATLMPASTYAASKLEMEVLVRRQALENGTDVVLARPFNQTGPGEPPRLVCSAIAKQIAAIEAGSQPPVVRVRSLTPLRDFTDVRDVAEAYWALLEAPASVYNICSGRTFSVADIVATLLEASTAGITVLETDPSEVPVPAQIGDSSRMRAATGWHPEISIEESLRDLLKQCRQAAAQLL
jgi:GDP-4-dehydro-6-deoxy-D-mannose reductase